MADQMLTQEEVWDDSALVKSWNEAYQEYKKYHSLAAKGEKVNVAALNTEQKSTNDSEQPEQQNPAEINLGSEDFAEDQVTAKIQSAPTVAAVRTIPQALAATVQDEDMKNLMMSWYYAGYYTGLYEGKQQGYASAMQGLNGG